VVFSKILRTLLVLLSPPFFFPVFGPQFSLLDSKRLFYLLFDFLGFLFALRLFSGGCRVVPRAFHPLADSGLRPRCSLLFFFHSPALRTCVLSVCDALILFRCVFLSSARHCGRT